MMIIMACAIGLLVACEGSFLLWKFTKIQKH